ncbi:heat shock protein [Biomphalaria glabrata]
MAPVTPPKRNSYNVMTSPISPPEQSSKRTRREHFDTAYGRHCLEISYGHHQADCSSYTTQRRTTYQQSSFQRNLWPASSDSSMLETHEMQRSHLMSTSYRQAHFSEEISMPFTQAYFTKEMHTFHHRYQGHFSTGRCLICKENVAQQKPFHPIQKNIAHQLSVPHGQPHKSQQKCFASEQKTTPSVKRSKSSKQKTVLPSKHEDVSKHSVQTNIAHKLSVPHVQPHYSQQSSFASEQKKILSVKRRQSSKQITVEPSNHKDVSPQTVEPSKYKDVSPHQTVIPTEVEYDKVSIENQCFDLISKNILQESFNQKDVAINAQ